MHDAVAKGATVLAAAAARRPGWYYPPTVVADITPEMRMFQEEVFGPVAGLSGGLVSTRPSSSPTPPRSGSAPTLGPTTRPSASASSDDAGGRLVFINGMVTSYPELPFGGVKQCGYGRELSAQGIRVLQHQDRVGRGAGQR